MQQVYPLLFRYSYRRPKPGRFTPDSVMDLTLDIPCRCPRCGKGFFKMSNNWNSTKLLGVLMLANFLIYIAVEVSRSHNHDRSAFKKHKMIPKEFWKKTKVSTAFWNREQERLDDIYYLPLVNASELPPHFRGIPRWLNHSCKHDVNVTAQIEDFNSLPQRFQDFLLYMGCRSYRLITRAPKVCSDPPYLLLAIKSLAPHFDRRQAIRESWGQTGILDGQRIATVFLLGNTAATDHFPDLSNMVKHEAELYGDVLQWDYRDSFFNLTLKEVLFLEWFGSHCATAQYVFKGDDDVFVNTRHMLAYLANFSISSTQDLFIGDVITNAGPHRSRQLKYYIPESVFTGGYPPYAGGGGYLYSGSVGLRLRKISRLVTLYPIDDVYTGMCLQRLGLVPEKHSGFKTFDIEEKHRENPCAYKSLILVHPRSPQDMIKIWSWINDPNAICHVTSTPKTKKTKYTPL